MAAMRCRRNLVRGRFVAGPSCATVVVPVERDVDAGEANVVDHCERITGVGHCDAFGDLEYRASGAIPCRSRVAQTPAAKPGRVISIGETLTLIHS